jgi:hypothetical protein
VIGYLLYLWRRRSQMAGSRPWWETALVVASVAIPLYLVCALNCFLYETFDASQPAFNPNARGDVDDDDDADARRRRRRRERHDRGVAGGDDDDDDDADDGDDSGGGGGGGGEESMPSLSARQRALQQSLYGDIGDENGFCADDVGPMSVAMMKGGDVAFDATGSVTGMRQRKTAAPQTNAAPAASQTKRVVAPAPPPGPPPPPVPPRSYKD